MLAAWLVGTMASAQEIAYSPDISLDLASRVAADEDVVDGAANLIDLGALPASVDVTAYHVIDGEPYFSIDTATVLPGGVFADGRDIVHYAGGTYEVFFDGSQKGVPDGVEIDALTFEGGALIFSFDIDTEIEGLFVADEDLVLFDGSYNLIFDGSGLGVPSSLDVDAVSFTENGQDLVLSFDTGGEVDGIGFFDQDGLRWEGGGSFSLEFNGMSVEAGLAAADLDALMLGGQPIDQGEIFSDGFETGNLTAWSSTVP